jgi:hypothetical protein
MKSDTAAFIALTAILAAVLIAGIAICVARMVQTNQGTCSMQMTPVRLRVARFSTDTRPVPRIIWQTYHTTDLPPVMRSVSNALRTAHPEFKYILADDAQCREFIQQHIGDRAVSAYDTLVPGAFKADLWRLCVLYVVGGFYLDLKYKLVPPYTFHHITSGMHLVQDLPHNANTVFNAFMICPPGDNRIHACIQRLIENVQNRKSSKKECLAVTGPRMVGQFFRNKDPVIDMIHVTNYKKDHGKIFTIHPKTDKADKLIIKGVKGYTKERSKYELKKHYGDLCAEDKVYIDS